MPFHPETPECKTSEERSRCLWGVLTVMMSRTISRHPRQHWRHLDWVVRSGSHNRLSRLFNLLPELVAVGNRNPEPKQRWSFMRTTFLLLMWLMLSSCDGRESGAVRRVPAFLPVQFRHLHHAIEVNHASSEWESGLTLMNTNYHWDINFEEVINTFVQRQPKRLLFAYHKCQSLVRT